MKPETSNGHHLTLIVSQNNVETAAKELKDAFGSWHQNNNDFVELTINLALKVKALKDACNGNNQAFNKALKSVNLDKKQVLNKDDRAALLIIADNPEKWRERLHNTRQRSWQHIVRSATSRQKLSSVRHDDENDDADEWEDEDTEELTGTPLKPKEADAFMEKVAGLLDVVGPDHKGAYSLALTFGPDQESCRQIMDLYYAMEDVVHHMNNVPAARPKKGKTA